MHAIAEHTASGGASRVVTAEQFGDLFVAHSRELYRFCLRRSGDGALAADLTSIVFLEGWRHRGRLQAGHERAWLYGIAVNVLRNQRRSLRRHRAALERIAPEPDEIDFAEDAATRMEDERRVRAILPLIDRLSGGEREVLTLCGWADLSYEECARALGVPVGTVRSRLSRARARIAEMTEEAKP
ncbi:MAG: RNA polymerase sigma factor, partial [Solirubrobacteraceae bacterium]